MMTDLEWIERYFRHELDEAERIAFEQRMAADEAFRQEVVRHERALAAIHLDGLRDLKQRLQQREAALRPRKSSAWKGWLTAVLLPVLLAAGWWFWKENTENSTPATPLPSPTADSLERRQLPSPDTLPSEQKRLPHQNNVRSTPPVAGRKPDAQALFAASFQPYRDASLNPTVRDKNSPAPFERFLQLYWGNRHAAALTAFENLSPALRESDDVRFLQANSLLATGQAAEAAVIFEAILARGTSRFTAQSHWYLALCWLKKGELDKAKKQLETLVSDAGAPHREDAVRLLAQLR